MLKELTTLHASMSAASGTTKRASKERRNAQADAMVPTFSISGFAAPNMQEPPSGSRLTHGLDPDVHVHEDYQSSVHDLYRTFSTRTLLTSMELARELASVDLQQQRYTPPRSGSSVHPSAALGGQGGQGGALAGYGGKYPDLSLARGGCKKRPCPAPV